MVKQPEPAAAQEVQPAAGPVEVPAEPAAKPKGGKVSDLAARFKAGVKTF
jgi:hypothetical protein